MRLKMELDYKQLKGQLSLDHYEGRSRLGWHHHTGLVTAAHGLLTLERLNPFPGGRPDTPEGRAADAADLQVLNRVAARPAVRRSISPAYPSHSRDAIMGLTKHYSYGGASVK
jgi:hypothetical protein